MHLPNFKCCSLGFELTVMLTMPGSCFARYLINILWHDLRIIVAELSSQLSESWQCYTNISRVVSGAIGVLVLDYVKPG
jgi:hypothetical protein